MIEKLTEYKSSEDGRYWVQHPTTQDIMEKINEIIRVVNRLEREYESMAKFITKG